MHNKYLKKTIESINSVGLNQTILKGKQYILNNFKRGIRFRKKNRQNWEKLKNKYADKRIFIIGNGPSLNYTPLYLLDNEYTICFNRFPLMFERLNFIPNFYMNVDPIVALNMKEEINTIIDKFDLVFIPDIHTNGLDYRKFINDHTNVYWLEPHFKGFYFDLPKVGLGGSVTFSALQVAVFLGFSEIYFIGQDMSYSTRFTGKLKRDVEVNSEKDDDPNHFDPRYFGAGQKYHLPNKSVIHNIENSFQYAKQILNKHKKIVVKNATIGGKFEVFERQNFQDIFNFDKDMILEKFLSSIRNNTMLKDINNSFLLRIKEINNIESVDSKDYFFISIKDSKANIRQYIKKYLIFGPYNNKLLFINRKLQK